MEADVKLLFGVLGGGSVSDGSGKEIAKDIARIVHKLEQSDVTKIKFSPDKKSVNKMLSTVQSQIDEGNRKKQFVVKVSKIDTAQALKGLRTDLEKVVKSISIKNGVDIKVNTKTFGEIASDAGTVKTNVDQASKVISKFSAQMKVLDTVQKSTGKALENVLNNSANISSKSGLAKLRAEYQSLLEHIEEIRQSKRIVDDEEMKSINDVIASIERKIKKYLDAAQREKNAAKDTAKTKKNAEKEAEDAARKAAAERERAAKKEQSDLAKLANLHDQIIRYKKRNSKIEGTVYGNRLDGLLATVEQFKSGNRNLSELNISDLINQFKTLDGEIISAGLSGKSLLNIIKEGYAKYGGWSLITKSMNMAWRTAKKMLSTIIDIDTAMTELRKVTNETEKAYDSFLSNATIRAKQLGATVVDTVSATADFARLGYSLDDASSLANAALIYKNVGDGIEDINDASEPIIASMKAFNIAAEDTMLIVDKFNATGNSFAITSGGIGDALLNSAAALDAAGNSIDESIALITAANNVVQDPEKVGTTLKTVSMYLRAAKTEAENAGESTDGMADSVSELRKEILALTGNKVDIQIDDDTFKNTYQILKELSVVWDDMTDVSQANLLEMLGGKRNSNVVAALLNDFSTAEDVIRTTTNAAGSALEENEKYLDSIDGKMSQLKASFEALSESIINSDLIKWAVDSGTSILTVLDKIVNAIGALPALISTASVAMSALDIKSPLSAYQIQYSPAGGNISKNFGLTSQTQIDVDAIKAYKAAMSGLVEGSEEAKQAFTDTMFAASATAKQFVQYNDVVNMSSKAMDGLKTSLNVYKASAIGAKVATTLLNSVISGLAGIAINLAIQWITKLINKKKELAEATMTAAESYETITTSISGYTSEISTLKEKLASDTASHEESYEARRRLLEIQNDIIQAYGLEANQLDLLTMSAEDSLRALNNITASVASDNLSKNATSIKDAIAHIEQERSYINAFWNYVPDLADDVVYDELEKVFKKHGNILNSNFNDAGVGTYFLSLSDDVYGAKETINALAKDIRDLDDILESSGKSVDDVFGGSNSFSKIFESALQDIDADLEKNNYGKIYEQAIQWKIVDNGTYFETQEKINALQEEYNDILAKTYDSENERQSALDGVVSKYYEIADIFNQEDFFDEDDLGVQRYFENILSGLGSAVKKHNAKSILEDTFNSYLEESKNARPKNARLGMDDVIDDVDALTFARRRFEEVARQAGMTEEQIELSIRTSTLAFSDQAGAIKDTNDETLSLVGSLNELATISENIDGLSAALGEFYENGSVSVDSLSGLTEVFGNIEGFDDLVATLTNTESSYKDVHEALNALGEEYIENTDILDKLNDKNKDAIAAYLEKKGVVNANAVVASRLAQKEIDAAVASGELSDAVWTNVEAFLSSAGASAATIQQIKLLRESEYEYALNNTSFLQATKEDFENLIELAGAAGLAKEKITALAKAKRLSSLIRDRDMSSDERAEYRKLLEELQSDASSGTEAGLTLDVVVDVNLPDGVKSAKDKFEEMMKELEEEFSKVIANFEHNIFLGEKNGADYNSLIAIYRQMQDAVHAQAEKYRKLGVKENSEYIQALQKQWWDYQDSINQLRQNHFDDYLNDSKFAIGALQTDSSDSDEIIRSWKEILSSINEEIEYYSSIGYDYTSEEIQKLVKEAWSAKEEITNAIKAVVDEANEVLDGFQDVYSTVTDAAKEYASTGYLSIDSLQSILSLGPKYLSFLQDENGQLVLNEEALQNVIAAKTEEMAVETAMAFAKNVLLAAQNNDIAALKELTQVNATTSASTWDLVYATLSYAKAIGIANGHSATYYDDAFQHARTMQALTKTTVSSIKEYYKTLDEDYVSQKDGLQTILELTKDLIKWENEQQIEALEKEKELYGKIVDSQKESLELAKKQDDHNDSIAEKLEKIARLQDENDMLRLDGSREAMAKVAANNEEIAELQKDVADEQAEYALEVHNEQLEKQQEAFEESKDAEIETLENTLNSTEKLYQAAIERIENDWDGLYNDLLDWNYEYGSTLQSDLVNAWDAASDAVQRYGSFVEALQGAQNYTGLGSDYSGDSSVGGADTSGNLADIKNRMMQNSFNWFLSGDKAKQAELSAENVRLAEDWKALTGQELTPKDYSWYTEDGSLFYSLNKQDVAEAVVAQMETNAANWKIADQQGDNAKKKALSDKNARLAADLAYYLKRKIENIHGTWYIDGKPLFQEYHTGGIVGHKGTLKQNEVMAVLEKGEIVLDEGKEKVLYRFVDFAQSMSEKIGRVLDASAFRNLLSSSWAMPDIPDSNIFPGANNNLVFSPTVQVTVEHTGNLTETDAKRFGSIAADSVLGELTDAFARRGISNMGSAFLR